MTTEAIEIVDRQAADDEAWRAYGEACHDPLATDEERARLFQNALATQAALISRDRAVMTAEEARAIEGVR